jgi:hypothetical protein
MINQQWLDTLCSLGTHHHHGYMYNRDDNTINILCGSNESTCACWVIDIDHGVATHGPTHDVVDIAQSDANELRRYAVDECKRYSSVTIDRCNESVCATGCHRARMKRYDTRVLVSATRLRPGQGDDSRRRRFVDSGPHRVVWSTDCGGGFVIKFNK